MTKEEFRDILFDFSKFAPRFLKIKDKAANIVPLKFNAAQSKIHAIVEKAVREKRPLRFIVLKARQEGASTYFEGLIFHRTITCYNHKTTIVGHEAEAATNLHEMAKRFHACLPDELKPIVQASNEKKLAFARLSSEIKIATAEVGGSLKRSDTIQDLHCTEVAFWRDAKSSLLALLQTVPDEDNTLVVLESTANGVGGEFHTRWKDAKEGRSAYIPIFLAWFELPEYSREFDTARHRERFEASLTEDEITLRDTYSLELEQLNWRRYTIENKCGGDAKLFQQEYPSNDVEAFLTSGRPVFDIAVCQRNYEKADQNPRIGNLRWVDEKRTRVEFVEHPAGYVRLYSGFEPATDREFHRFAAGTDVAEGLEQGDYSSIPVLDRKLMRVTLTWHGHIDPDLLAGEQHKIQVFLGGPGVFKVCTERNNHGLVTILDSYKLGVSQYYDMTFKSGILVSTDHLGFRTTTLTKPVILDILGEAIREKAYDDPDRDFWGECMTFVRNSHGQMQAQGKDTDSGTRCFDDRVMGRALMLACHRWMPSYVEIKPKPGRREHTAAYLASHEFVQNEIFDKAMKRARKSRRPVEAL